MSGVHKVNGITGTLASLSAIFGVVPFDTTYRRVVRHNWPVDKALLTPVIATGHVRKKPCGKCETLVPNNAHKCPACHTQTEAGKAAQLRKQMK
jgi:ribosomal protein L40E